MNKHNKKRLLIVLGAVVLLFAVLVRMYKLDQYPPQLNRDEAALALNALYIHQSGMDEWGHRFPVQFQSFGDFKLPGYVYLLNAFFTVNISDVSVRLPSALAGIVVIAMGTYFAFQLFQKRSSTWFFIFLGVSICVSPFAVFYSRMAWEANVGLALMLSALALLYHRLPTFKKDLSAIVLFFFASITYNSPFLLLPLIILSLPFYRGIRSFKTWRMSVVTLSVLFVTIFLLFSQNNAQKSGILFFSDANVLAAYPEYRSQFPSVLKQLVGNKFVYFSSIAFSHYRDTFLPNFLVIHGGSHPWHSLLGKGHLFWTTYFLFVIGFISQIKMLIMEGWKQFRQKNSFSHMRKESVLALFLLFISPLPSIFTVDSPHATRSLFTFVMIVLYSALGFEFTLTFITQKLKKFRNMFIGSLFLLLLLESTQYLYQYFIIWPTNFSPDFQLGFVPELQKTVVEHPTENIGIVDLGWYLYVLVAWYDRIPAETALSTVHRTGPDTVGLYRVDRIGRYYFLYHPDDIFPDPQAVISKDRQGSRWTL